MYIEYSNSVGFTENAERLDTRVMTTRLLHLHLDISPCTIINNDARIGLEAMRIMLPPEGLPIGFRAYDSPGFDFAIASYESRHHRFWTFGILLCVPAAPAPTSGERCRKGTGDTYV